MIKCETFPTLILLLCKGALTMDLIVTLYEMAETGSEKESMYEKILWEYSSLSKRHQFASPCLPYISQECEAHGGPGEPKVTGKQWNRRCQL
jgi:hypothetical protein